MLKILTSLLSFYLALALSSPSYATDSFSNLKQFDTGFGITLEYDPAITTLYQGKYPDSEYAAAAASSGVSVTRVFRTKIDREKPMFFTVDCDSGPSGDPTCTIFFEEKNKLLKAGTLAGTQFIFPGNGYVYTAGHTNNMFNQRNKFALHNKKLVKIKQPFYYVGLDTVTNENITLYQSTQYQQPVATLPIGTAVTVLANQNNHYLVKTSFGLLGWVKIPVIPLGEKSPLEGLYFNGD